MAMWNNTYMCSKMKDYKSSKKKKGNKIGANDFSDIWSNTVKRTSACFRPGLGCQQPTKDTNMYMYKQRYKHVHVPVAMHTVALIPCG